MSALIWLAIVGVWGFVLIPMWLRHHDGALEQRSADRFSAAMRVLSRRGARAALTRAAAADQDGADGTWRADHLGRPEDDAYDEDADDPAPADVPLPARAPAGPRRGAESRSVSDAHAVEPSVATSAPGLAAGVPLSRLDLDEDRQGRAHGPAGPAGRAAFGTAPASRRPGPGRRPGAARTGTPDGPDHDGPDETAHTVAVGPTRPVPPARTADSRRQALLRLRRQRLGVLLAAVPVTIGLAVGLAGMWIVVQLLVDAGLVAYVTHLRRSTQTERRLVASRAARDRRIAAQRAARKASRSSAVPVGGPMASAAPAVDDRRRRTGGEDRAAVPAGRWAATGSATGRPEPYPADGTGDDGDAAGATRAGRADRPASPEYAPVRLSGEHSRPLTGEDLAAASAQTVELGGYVAAASATASATGPAAGDEPAAPSVAAQDDGYVNNVRVTGTRPVSRPGARPATSRPGRVQVNPPGTHGGLTAPPAAATGAAGPAGNGHGPPAAPAAGPPAGGHEQDDAVRVLRPAVGS